MKIRITWRSEVTIEGNSLNEIQQKWEGMPLFSDELKKAGAEYVELVSAEKCDDTGYPVDDITGEFND